MLQLLTDKQCPEALQTLAFYAEKLKNHALKELPELFATFRGYEGSLSKAYFGTIRELLPRQYRFEKRSQHPAMDMFNCLLNYAYGMLYGQCESAMIRAGIDPAVGVMHRDEYNRPVLVYDFIEAYRHYADYVVCHLCVQEVIFEEFFDVENGQFWLNTDGKRLLIQCMNDYLNELVNLAGLSRSRLTHLELDAQRLATALKKMG
jgi:CRISPR-associated protein Cas1